jgi:pimeloyl-ACP methyl ester carboxylesterase
MASIVNKNPSVVLVHGAYADGSSCSQVIERLQGAGVAVTAVQNPLTSLADDVARTHHILALQPGPVILAGHSFAGTVITQAGIHPAVAGLVYIAARAPDAGEDHQALAGRFPVSPASAGLIYADGHGALTEHAFLNDFANDRTTVAAWRSRPTWYAISRQDRTIAPDLQRFLAQRMHATTTEIDAGHLSIVTHPDEVARLIVAAVRAVAQNPLAYTTRN